jgi:biopolymer transport protein ExbB
MKLTPSLVVILIGMLLAGVSHASWNSDWASRQKILLNTTADGTATQAVVDSEPILVRLHTGNFAFADAKADGSDLRFIAEDDKTPLKFHIESYDSLTEVALIWVTVPKLAPASKDNFIWLYYNNPKAPAAGDAKSTYDASQAVIFHFAEPAGPPHDATAYGNNADTSSATNSPSSLIGAGVTLNGSSKITLPASPSLKIGGNGITVSMWIKADGAAQDAVLFRQVDGANSVALLLQSNKLVGQINTANVQSSVDVTSGAWHHLALVAKDQLAIYLDGQKVGETPAAAPGIAGSIEIGQGFKGDLDEFELSYTQRSADWIRVAALGQGVDQKLVTYGAGEGGDESSSPSYFKILLGSVTLDGWVVIGILMVMMVISVSVMVTKSIFVTRTGRANQDFKEEFGALGRDLTALAKPAAATSTKGKIQGPVRSMSSMYRIYEVGTIELRKRLVSYKEAGKALILSPQSIDAIRASLDATLIRELQRLNAQMVLLTIAIAGGPFLGLLGTVVGVMITFAAIAAAGDVNVNAIAPGIAAALVATVAGLGVAIPSLFGYNYLASKIKELTTDMQVFVDEFITRLAENYSE